ncbi:MAG: trypsin-like peptidase domain-containing protein [Planctomycetes bacterium]|nr:trypsin-like peptidase domain-containing protein [Planctomycetota bacterium]
MPTPVGAWPSFRDLVARVSPAVVTVRARRSTLPPGAENAVAASEPPAGAGQVAASESVGPVARRGTGFVVHEDGLVLTSRHVIVEAGEVDVQVAGLGWMPAALVGEDAASDLALLRLEQAPAGLPFLELGPSEELRAGDWIVTVGDPYGFTRTVTAGLVSFVGRHLQHSDLGVTSDFLQISAAINPGSSGCPVFDVQGRVVGLTTQIAAGAEGISFAVPSRSIKWALEAMQRRPDGRVRRGYLGIEFSSRYGYDSEGKPSLGALIVGVASGEAADRAGLRRGDVVLRVDGDLVHDAKDLHERIVRCDPGTPLALELMRDGIVRDAVVAVLGEVGDHRLRDVGHPN